MAILLWCSKAFSQSIHWEQKTSNGFAYKIVKSDPSNSRFYTLKNGLTVILSKNEIQPKIQFRLAVRAGSNTDPKRATGLAHYLEHLMFKGTERIGTLDFGKEKHLLDKIEILYEEYNRTSDVGTRKEIYRQIDKVSNEASKFVIANEYLKLMKSIGGTSTNAHTWYEETVYKEDFPSNMVDKFLIIQSERFRSPVFRLFHTELEAVYEEKNRRLDNDMSALSERMLAALFPTHNYGQQTTIGTIEHLKNPSLLEIREYYEKYYVPNNMVIVMSGDFNSDEMIKKIDHAFSYMKPRPLTLYQPDLEKPIDNVKKVEVFGPSSENVSLMFRVDKQNSKESLMLKLIESLLFNGKTGLIDVRLNKEQKVLQAYASLRQMKDYGVFNISAMPKQGQSLEQVQQLLLDQVNSLRNGNFDENIISAIVANKKLKNSEMFMYNSYRADELTNEFVLSGGKDWDRTIGAIEEMAKVSKVQIIEFANNFFKENYVVGYKRKGVDKSILKVEKPAITQIETNPTVESNFAKELANKLVKPITPKFINYQSDLNFGKSGIAETITVPNTENNLFRMTYHFDMGTLNERLLPYAVQYLDFLSTSKWTNEAINRQLYDLASSYDLQLGNEFFRVTISGLQENFEKLVQLVDHVFANVVANENALSKMKNSILMSRENKKGNKTAIMNGLINYAQYGAVNPFNSGLSYEEIKALTSAELIEVLQKLFTYRHTIGYYGPLSGDSFVKQIKNLHKLPPIFTEPAPPRKFTYQANKSTKVYFTDYNMVQAEINWVKNDGILDFSKTSTVRLFNNYISSIVFQQIREAKALAYSSSASYSATNQIDRKNLMSAYVGSQADKMIEAIQAMDSLLVVLPASKQSFEASKQNLLNVYQTEWLTQDAIIHQYLDDRKKGYRQDARIDQYRTLEKLTWDDVLSFHRERASNGQYQYCIVGAKDKIDKEYLKKLGDFKELTLKEIFGF